jgi:hypothetical protein
MKIATTTLLMFLTASLGIAQGLSKTDTTDHESKHFRIFGTDVTISKNEEGNSVWEFTETGMDSNKSKNFNKYPKSDGGLTFDIGINQWIETDPAPTVKPWGSWNPAINAFHSYYASKNFFLKTTLGVSWYNFKFEDRNLQALRNADGVYFEEHPSQTGIRSKISASYANLTLVPTIRTSSKNFRFGVGGYAGMRLGGRGKFVYRDTNGNKMKEFQMGNMFANDFRYGLRSEIGIGEVDFYINYDLNEFFQKDKGPRVNALSFGIII